MAPPPATKHTRSTKPKVFVTNGRDIALKGVCLVFTKIAQDGTAITEQNITKVRIAFFNSSGSSKKN